MESGVRHSKPLVTWLAARPAATVAAFFIPGILLHESARRDPLLWIFIAACALILGARLGALRPRISAALLAPAITAAGIAAGQLGKYQYPAHHIALYASDEPRLAAVEVVLPQSPQVVEESGPRPLPPRQIAKASVVAIKTWNGWEPATGQMLISVSGAEPRLAAGQRVRLLGMLQRPPPAMNPGQFDWESYYRRQDILVSLHVNHGFDIGIVGAGSASSLGAARQGIREWLALGFGENRQIDLSLLQALLLGDRDRDLWPVEEDFRKTGTTHLLASSGLRMAVLAACVLLVCRVFRAGPRFSAVTMMLAVFGWGLLTIASPQAIRPVIAAVALGLGLMRCRMLDAIQALALAAITILVCRPMDVYGAGFQLSFIIVLGMLLLTPPLVEFLGRFRNDDLEVLEQLHRLTPRQRLRRWAIRRLTEAFAAALVAWMVSLPLVAYHFGQFTPWAVPVSIVLSPLVFASLAGGFFKIVLTLLIPGGAGIWAGLAAIPVSALRHGIALFAKLPGADIPVTAPSVWMILAFYALLCLPLLPAGGTLIRRCARCGPVAGCVLLLLVPWLVGFARQSTSGGKARVTLLALGAGQCAVVEPPDGAPILVDAGSTTLADPLHACIEPFLRHEGRAGVDAVYLSHGDYDHISAVSGMWRAREVNRVFTSPHFRNHAIESVPCRRLLELLDRSGHSPRQIVAGDCLDWGGGVKVEVLWPPKQCDFNSNNAGVVLRLVYGGVSILLPADIQDPAMHELLLHPQRLKSDVLIAAHHGSSEPLTAQFVAAVNPRVILSSNASRLTKKQRDFEQLIDTRPLYRTGRCGAITIDIDQDGKISITPFLERRQRGMVLQGTNFNPP